MTRRTFARVATVAVLMTATIAISASIVLNTKPITFAEPAPATTSAPVQYTPTPTPTPVNDCMVYLMRHNEGGRFTKDAPWLCAAIARTHTPAQMHKIFGPDVP